MAEQYLRVCNVTADGGGGSLDFGQLRVRFDVHQKDISTPHVANIYITNPARADAEKFRQEYKSVTLTAGYGSGAGVIFKGEILQVRFGRDNVSDTYIHILATSGERARNFAIANKTLAAGHTFRDRVDVAAKAFAGLGVTVGHIDDLGSKKFSRGFSCFGMAKDLLREVCTATGSSWHIHNQKLNVVKNENTLPGDVIVLNANTGMIGLPEQTLQGVIVRCLLNYRIRPAQKIQLNNKSIQQAAFDPSVGGAPSNYQLGQGGLALAADGLYKCLLVEHNGDTRGPNWYTEIVCVKNDGGYSPALISRGVNTAEGN